MTAKQGKTGARGARGIQGDDGIRGDTGFFDTTEVVKMLERLETKSDNQMTTLNQQTVDLAVIKEQVQRTNGTVKKNCNDIDKLYMLNNDKEKRWAEIGAFKYIAVILGIIATVIAIAAFFINK